MLLPKEKAVLDEIIGWEDARSAVEYILAEYASKGTENSLHILGQIQNIATILTQQADKKASDYYRAAWFLIAQRTMEPDQSGMFFSTMLPVCKAMFPGGKADGHCESMRRYFQQFLDMFRDKKQFSWEKDKKWAENNDYIEYLKLVEQQNGGAK